MIFRFYKKLISYTLILFILLTSFPLESFAQDTDSIIGTYNVLVNVTDQDLGSVPDGSISKNLTQVLAENGVNLNSKARYKDIKLDTSYTPANGAKISNIEMTNDKLTFKAKVTNVQPTPSTKQQSLHFFKIMSFKNTDATVSFSQEAPENVLSAEIKTLPSPVNVVIKGIQGRVVNLTGKKAMYGYDYSDELLSPKGYYSVYKGSTDTSNNFMTVRPWDTQLKDGFSPVRTKSDASSKAHLVGDLEGGSNYEQSSNLSAGWGGARYWSNVKTMWRKNSDGTYTQLTRKEDSSNVTFYDKDNDLTIMHKFDYRDDNDWGRNSIKVLNNYIFSKKPTNQYFARMTRDLQVYSGSLNIKTPASDKPEFTTTFKIKVTAYTPFEVPPQDLTPLPPLPYKPIVKLAVAPKEVYYTDDKQQNVIIRPIATPALDGTPITKIEYDLDGKKRVESDLDDITFTPRGLGSMDFRARVTDAKGRVSDWSPEASAEAIKPPDAQPPGIDEQPINYEPTKSAPHVDISADKQCVYVGDTVNIEINHNLGDEAKKYRQDRPQQAIFFFTKDGGSKQKISQGGSYFDTDITHYYNAFKGDDIPTDFDMTFNKVGTYYIMTKTRDWDVWETRTGGVIEECVMEDDLNALLSNGGWFDGRNVNTFGVRFVSIGLWSDGVYRNKTVNGVLGEDTSKPSAGSMDDGWSRVKIEVIEKKPIDFPKDPPPDVIDKEEKEVKRHSPVARLSANDPKYQKEVIDLFNDSTDEDNDIVKANWKIYDTDGTTLLAEQDWNDSAATVYNTDILHQAQFNRDKGQAIFKEFGRYKVWLQVIDADGNTDSTTRWITVMQSPIPPVANISMKSLGYVNEPVQVLDRSTDANGLDDIVRRDWTNPTDNVSGTVSGMGGTLTFKKTGTYTVGLKVTDKANLSDATTATIEIIDPIPQALIAENGTRKVNRKFVVHSRASITPKSNPIDHKKDEWEITPITSGINQSDIKIKDTGDNSERVLLFKKEGDYKIRLRVDNGYSKSQWVDKIVHIFPDEKPIAQFDVDNSIPNFIDNPSDFTIGVHDTSYSKDGDTIAYRKWTWWYDSNGDGKFDDETPNVVEGGKDLPIHADPSHTGKYKVKLFVREEFGEETIPDFVTIDDRLTDESQAKEFIINWQPDIEFGLDKWCYTDDTVNVKTVLKDDKLDTVKVNWSIWKSDETTKELKPADIDTYCEYNLTKDGGTIRFKESGYYSLIGEVEDEYGAKSSWVENIRVYHLPVAQITDEPTLRWKGKNFTTKENRKFKMDGKTSYAYDYYGPELHPIDHSKDYWEIIPLDGQNTDIIKIQNESNGTLVNQGDSTKFIRNNDSLDETMLFKQKGKYKVRYQITNTYGKKSPFEEQVVDVAEDTLPDVNFQVVPTVYRDAKDSNNAELVSYSITSSSNDLDTIDIESMRYRFDSNNNGSYTDETWSSNIPIISGRATFKTTHVGMYQVEFTAKEKYGQETIDAFVTDSDRRVNHVYREINVDNHSPLTSLALSQSNKVDVIFTLGDIDPSKLTELNTKINNYVKSKLLANNNDLLDAEISTIQTVETNMLSGRFSVNVYWGNNGSDMDSHMRFYNSSGGEMGHISYQNKSMYGCSLDTDDTKGGVGEWLTLDFDSIPSTVNKIDFEVVPFRGSASTTIYLYKDVEGKRECPVSKTVSVYSTTSFGYLVRNGNSWDFHGSGGEYVPGKVIKTKVQTLDETLKEPKWRDNADKFVVNLSDVNLPELNDTDKTNIIISRLLGDDIDFSMLGTVNNKSQTDNLIAQNQGNGAFFYNYNIDDALQKLGDYILNKVNGKKRENIHYVLLGEKVKYTTNFQDYENDPEIKQRWKYKHNENYFKNSLGKINYNDIYLDKYVDTFDKVGAYNITYEGKDDPTKDSRFDNYNYWSTMQGGDFILYVHRKPLARFGINMKPVGANYTVSLSDNSYDLDHQGELGNGISEVEWKWKEEGATTWNNGMIPNTLPVGKTYLVQLRVRDIDGEGGKGEWSDPEVRVITTKNINLPPVAQFDVAPNPLPIQKTLTWQDSSYDPNGDPLIEYNWVVKRDNGTVLYVGNTIPTNYSAWGVGTYKIILKVRDNPAVGTSLWSDEYIQTLKVVLENQPPVANFNPVPNPVKVNDPFNWNESSTDPDGDPLKYEWKLERYAVRNISDIKGEPNNTYTFNTKEPFANGQSFEKNGMPYGAYRVTLKVTDIPSISTLTPKSSYMVKTIYVVPRVSVTGSSEGEAITGNTIIIKAVTNPYVTDVKVSFLGDTITLNKSLENGTNIYWEASYVIPDRVTVSGDYPAVFTATTDYGGNGSITNTATDTINIHVTALKLENFRITNIVNHKQYTYPLYKNDLYKDYKAGYYATFRIDAKGNPESVKADTYLDSNLVTTIDLKKVETNGTVTTWEGKYFAPARTPIGTMVRFDLTAYKGNVTYNYNSKEPWSGDSLKVVGTALEDGRINRTN